MTKDIWNFVQHFFSFPHSEKTSLHSLYLTDSSGLLIQMISKISEKNILEWPWNKSKLCNTQEFIRNVGIWPVEIFFLKDLLCWLSFHLTVSRVCLRATSCSSEVSPVVFKHQLLAQNFSIWCWIFINFNIHIVLFCWYQSFHGMSLQCNTLGKIARNKTSHFTLIQILSFINDQYLSEPTTHQNKEPQVCMQLPSGKRRRRQGKHLQKKKKTQLIVLLTALSQTV